MPKTNEKRRLVVDYRPINQETIVDQYHLLRSKRSYIKLVDLSISLSCIFTPAFIRLDWTTSPPRIQHFGPSLSHTSVRLCHLGCVMPCNFSKNYGSFNQRCTSMTFLCGCSLLFSLEILKIGLGRPQRVFGFIMAI